jgi:hypothetical protein
VPPNYELQRTVDALRAARSGATCILRLHTQCSVFVRLR